MKKKTYYYHSPRIEGERRHTLTGIIVNGEMSIGIASCSKKDVFIKSRGRELSEVRAEQEPICKIKLGRNPHTGIAFREIATGIAISMLSPKYKLIKVTRKKD